MMPVDSGFLRDVQQAATPGPWQHGYHDGSGRENHDHYVHEGGFVLTENETTVVWGGNLDGLSVGVLYGPDADFIATFDPQVVGALLDVAEAARQIVSPKQMGSAHVRMRDANYCDSCLRSWPCEGSQLSDALDRLGEVLP